MWDERGVRLTPFGWDFYGLTVTGLRLLAFVNNYCVLGELGLRVLD